MRKRSKKRIPQDVKPWIGINPPSEETLTLPNKKTTKWVAGSRRNWDTKILNQAVVEEVSTMLWKALIKTFSDDNKAFSSNLIHKLDNKVSKSHKMSSLARYKNFCLFSGRGRTYNRLLFMARHNMRKLVAVGAISGLTK